MVGLVMLALVALLLARCTDSGSPDGRAAPSTLPPDTTGEGPDDGFNSADRLIFWTDCKSVAALDDAGLDTWKARGVDGFVCSLQSLRGLGGPIGFSGAPGADLSGPGFEVQRSLRDSRLVERARDRGMLMYLSFYLGNSDNPATPLKEWFDDPGWADVVAPTVRDLALGARQLGFAGLAFDQELYPQAGGVSTATWSAGYPGATHSLDEVRSKAKARGSQLMTAILEGFPAVKLLAYATKFPGSWEEVVQQEVNDIDDPFGGSVQIDFWDGLTAVDGWSSVNFLNATFYKTQHLSQYDWDDALRYEYTHLFALLSQRFSNWDYAATRVAESPFSWISSGGSAFERARSTKEVDTQLDAFSRWGMDRLFANYAYENLEIFDYTEYVPAMTKASTPRMVTDSPPEIEVGGATGSGAGIVLTGKASDEYAVRFVHWETDGGLSGMARVEAKGQPGDDAEVSWTTPPIPAHAAGVKVKLTVESVKGLSTTVERTLAPGG